VKISSEENEDNRWLFFILIIFFLCIISFVIYIIMQEWYKRKYETHLFKNRNNLYNLIKYIENAKKKNLTDNQIYSKLKKTGWKSEQINYALNKQSGKRTGMFEVPFIKILNKFKKKKVQPLNQNIPQKKMSFNPMKKIFKRKNVQGINPNAPQNKNIRFNPNRKFKKF